MMPITSSDFTGVPFQSAWTLSEIGSLHNFTNAEAKPDARVRLPSLRQAFQGVTILNVGSGFNLDRASDLVASANQIEHTAPGVYFSGTVSDQAVSWRGAFTKGVIEKGFMGYLEKNKSSQQGLVGWEWRRHAADDPFTEPDSTVAISQIHESLGSFSPQGERFLSLSELWRHVEVNAMSVRAMFGAELKPLIRDLKLLSVMQAVKSRLPRDFQLKLSVEKSLNSDLRIQLISENPDIRKQINDLTIQRDGYFQDHSLMDELYGRYTTVGTVADLGYSEGNPDALPLFYLSCYFTYDADAALFDADFPRIALLMSAAQLAAWKGETKYFTGMLDRIPDSYPWQEDFEAYRNILARHGLKIENLTRGNNEKNFRELLQKYSEMRE